MSRESKNRCREMRRLLGLCIHCQEPVVKSYTRCQKHLDENVQVMRRQRKKQAKARGWRLKRVPA